jgi:hypothetical protein
MRLQSWKTYLSSTNDKIAAEHKKREEEAKEAAAKQKAELEKQQAAARQADYERRLAEMRQRAQEADRVAKEQREKREKEDAVRVAAEKKRQEEYAKIMEEQRRKERQERTRSTNAYMNQFHNTPSMATPKYVFQCPDCKMRACASCRQSLRGERRRGPGTWQPAGSNARRAQENTHDFCYDEFY